MIPNRITISIYLNKDISIGERKAITIDLFDYIEVNNQFWETEDDGYLREGHIPVDIVYRDLDFLIGNLRNKLEFFQADVGYTTCIWAIFSVEQAVREPLDIFAARDGGGAKTAVIRTLRCLGRRGSLYCI